MRILKALGSGGVALCMTIGLVGLPTVQTKEGTAVSVAHASALTSLASTSTSVKLIVDDELIPTDSPPQIYQGRVMVPLRWVSEALGSRVKWDKHNKTISVNTSVVPVKKGGGIQIWINGKPLPKDTPTLIHEGRVLVPARVIAEGLGASVEWSAKEQAVYIRVHAIKGRNEWESVSIKQLNDLQFMHPAGWGFSRSIGAPPTDKVQKQLDQSLDQILTILKQGKRVDPIDLKQPIRRVNISMQEYTDSEGNEHYGGGIKLSISGTFAKLIWQDTLSRPIYLHFPQDSLNKALDKVEKLLPARFPSLKTKITTVPKAFIKSDIITTNLVAEKSLPLFNNMKMFKDPMTGNWGAINLKYESDGLIPELLTSNDGVNWSHQDMTIYNEFKPQAYVKLNDDYETLLMTNATDSSIYRTELHKPETEQQWELVWQYPWPEALDKYSPVQYILDPVKSGRVYTAFAHDTRFPSTNGLFMSEDSGLSWFESGINGQSDIQFVWPEPALPDPKKTNTVYLETGIWTDASNDMYYYMHGSAFISQDAGRNWLLLEGIDELYDVSKHGEDTIITAARHDTYTSWLLISRDHGTTWSERKLPFKISDLKVNTANPKVMIATPLSQAGTMPYYSADGGATWRPVELPNQYIQYWIPESNLVYVHGEKGTTIVRLEI